MSKFIAQIKVIVEMFCVPDESLSSLLACLRESSHLLHLFLIKVDFICLTFCCYVSRFMAIKKLRIFKRSKESHLRSSNFSQLISKER